MGTFFALGVGGQEIHLLAHVDEDDVFSVHKWGITPEDHASILKYQKKMEALGFKTKLVKVTNPDILDRVNFVLESSALPLRLLLELVAVDV